MSVASTNQRLATTPDAAGGDRGPPTDAAGSVGSEGRGWRDDLGGCTCTHVQPLRVRRQWHEACLGSWGFQTGLRGGKPRGHSRLFEPGSVSCFNRNDHLDLYFHGQASWRTYWPSAALLLRPGRARAIGPTKGICTGKLGRRIFAAI